MAPGYDAHCHEWQKNRAIHRSLAHGYRNADPNGMANIAQDVCIIHGITVEELRGSSRKVRFSFARKEFCYLVKASMKEKSYPEIGRWLGGRDHTTVLHLARRWKERLEALA